jgi:integrase
LAHEKKRGLAPASLSVILRTIRRFFAVALEQGHLSVNPAKAVMAPSVTVEPVKFLTDDQVARLLASIAKATLEDVRDAALFRVLASGMRRGELIGLRVGDVDLDAKPPTVTIRASTSKTRTGRKVAISRDAAAHLRVYIRVRAAYIARNGRQDDGALWQAAKGPLSANGALQMVYRRLDAAGLPRVSLHSFRHRWGARSVQNGMPLPYIIQQGGWQDGTMINTRYGMFGVEKSALSAMADHLDR